MKTSHLVIGGAAIAALAYLESTRGWSDVTALKTKITALIGGAPAAAPTAPAAADPGGPVSSPTDYGYGYVPTASNGGNWQGSMPSPGGGGGVVPNVPTALMGARYVHPLDARTAMYAAHVQPYAQTSAQHTCTGCSGAAKGQQPLRSPGGATAIASSPASRYMGMLHKTASKFAG